MSVTNASTWYVDFFNGFIADLQRRFMFSPEQTAADIEVVASLLRLPPASEVLDVPCGTGRIAIGLAEKGYRMTGVDFTAEYLADARQDAERRNLAIEWHEADMRDLPWTARFDGAVCFGNSFSYFDDEGNAAFLAAVARTLPAGGVFLLQTNVAAEGVLPNLLPGLRGRSWLEWEGKTLLHGPNYDPLRGEINSDYISIDNGKTDRRRATYRVYMLRELIAMLQTAGFADIETFGATAKDSFVLGSADLHLRALKT